jgi:hypothetical protein
MISRLVVNGRPFAFEGASGGSRPRLCENDTTSPNSGHSPLECLESIAPLRIDRGVLVRRAIALCCLQFRKLGFRIRVLPKLVIDHREALLTVPIVRLGLAGGARALKIPEPVIGEPAFAVGRLEVGLQTDDFCESRNRLLIAARRIQRPAEQGMALAGVIPAIFTAR